MTKVAWIIGASAGIGAETAIKLSEEGYDVCVSARSEDKLKQVKSSLKSSRSWVLPVDVTDLESLKSGYEKLKKISGQVDLILYGAGVYDPMPLKEFDLEKSLQTLDVNLNGCFNLFEVIKEDALNPDLKLKLAWIASVAGYRGLPNSAAYGASKAALINFCEIQRAELSDTNTTVQVINPGFVKTRLTDKNSFEMPMLITADQAAKAIVKGLKSNKFEIAFPGRFIFFMKLLRILPNSWYLALARKLAKAEN